MIEETTTESVEAASRGVADSIKVLSAIGAAWSTYTLYPNPAQQPAFGRAVAELSEFAAGGPIIDVGAGTFTFRNNPLPVARDGLDRLATQFFIHDLEAFRFMSAPTAEELVLLFDVVSDEDIGGESTVEERLIDGGVKSIVVWARGLLGSYGDRREDGYEEGWGDGRSVRRTKIAELAELGVDAGFLVESLHDLAGGDSDLLAKHFVDAFVELHMPDPGLPKASMADLGEALMPYLADDIPPSPLVTFVDAFRLLEGEERLRVFELFLDSVDDATHRLFVDQFGGEELGNVAGQLDDDYSGALLEYVRESLDRPDGSFEDLLPPLHSAEGIADMRREASDRIAGILADREQQFDPDADIFAALRTELTAPFPTTAEIDVLRRLFTHERRQHRFRRLVRVWTGRISDAMREKDYRRAVQIVEAIQNDPPYAADDRHIVEEALGGLVTEDLLESMWETNDRDERSDLPDLVAALGAGVVDRLIEELAGEENAGRRKVLVELLGGLAGQNLRSITSRLNDRRWYVVRNLATVLGRSGNPGAAKALQDLTKHDDYRVRVEAVRALVPIDSVAATDTLIEMLWDSNNRVRQTALTYLRNGLRPVAPLVAAIGKGGLEPDVATSLVSIIAKQRSPEAVSALKDLAGRKVAVRGADRSVRQAAKEALKGMR